MQDGRGGIDFKCLCTSENIRRKRLYTVLHQVFELAVEDDYIRNNPSDHALKELKQAHNLDGVKGRL